MSSAAAQKLLLHRRKVNEGPDLLNTDGLVRALKEYAELNKGRAPKEAEEALELCKKALPPSKTPKDG